MIVKDLVTFRKHLPSVVLKGGLDPFIDSLEIAQEKLQNEILGKDLIDALEAQSSEHEHLLKLATRVICYEGFLINIPDMDLILTDAGFAVTNNEKMAPASPARVQALTASIKSKLDGAKDALINHLMTAPECLAWRGTEQFERLSDSLIFTYQEFKDLAIYNQITADAYPKCWSDFFDLNGSMNVALMTDVASYISKDYAEEILEKLRDNERFLPIEKKVLKIIKIAVIAIALGDRKSGLEQAIIAHRIMKQNISDFPTFEAAPESQELTTEHTDSPIFMMF